MSAVLRLVLHAWQTDVLPCRDVFCVDSSLDVRARRPKVLPHPSHQMKWGEGEARMGALVPEQETAATAVAAISASTLRAIADYAFRKTCGEGSCRNTPYIPDIHISRSTRRRPLGFLLDLLTSL